MLTPFISLFDGFEYEFISIHYFFLSPMILVENRRIICLVAWMNIQQSCILMKFTDCYCFITLVVCLCSNSFITVYVHTIRFIARLYLFCFVSILVREREGKYQTLLQNTDFMSFFLTCFWGGMFVVNIAYRWTWRRMQKVFVRIIDGSKQRIVRRINKQTKTIFRHL